MTPANRDSFTSSFQIWKPFVPLSCLIALARTSSVEVKRSGLRNRSGVRADTVIFLILVEKPTVF